MRDEVVSVAMSGAVSKALLSTSSGQKRPPSSGFFLVPSISQNFVLAGSRRASWGSQPIWNLALLNITLRAKGNFSATISLSTRC